MRGFLLLMAAVAGLSGFSAMADMPMSSDSARRDLPILVECEDSATSEFLRSRVDVVLAESRTALAEINPRILRQLNERLATRKLLITCVSPKVLEARNAEADSEGILFRPYRIRVRAERLRSTAWIMDFKHVLLHELLHFAQVRNQSNKKHNQVTLSNVLSDLIYMCAYAVYPSYFSMDRDLAIRSCQTLDGA